MHLTGHKLFNEYDRSGIKRLKFCQRKEQGSTHYMFQISGIRICPEGNSEQSTANVLNKAYGDTCSPCILPEEVVHNSQYLSAEQRAASPPTTCSKMIAASIYINKCCAHFNQGIRPNTESTIYMCTRPAPRSKSKFASWLDYSNHLVASHTAQLFWGAQFAPQPGTNPSIWVGSTCTTTWNES